MSYQRLAYDDADTAGQMHDDAEACGSHIALPRQRIDEILSEQITDLSKDAKPQIEVSDAAAYLASRMHLHLD